jgi:hypothetical protein
MIFRILIIKEKIIDERTKILNNFVNIQENYVGERKSYRSFDHVKNIIVEK